MEVLVVDIDGSVVAEVGLDAGCVEVGRRCHCDVVLPASVTLEHSFLVQRMHGAVFVHTLHQDGPSSQCMPLPKNERRALGGGLAISRRSARSNEPIGRGSTDRLDVDAPLRSLGLVLGSGPEARHVPIKRKPICVGSAKDNDLVLSDRAVSRHHFRIESSEAGVVIRDLGSRNGTWLGGARVQLAGIRPGALLRVGRSNLQVTSRCLASDDSHSGFIAESPAMTALLADVDNFSGLPWPVLILGESGTGKEEVARALHRRGSRSERPFVALNAGGLPPTLVESELFGHEKGAFTGASGVHRGVFEQADKGTLFLDEIGELPLELQARLLRVLENWMIRRVGAEADRRIDVRLICATHQDLRAMVNEGNFREDLFYRINRLLIEVPPLHQRPEDVQALSGHFLNKIESDVGAKRLTADALRRLMAYPWPGNARELRNVLEIAAATNGGVEIDRSDIEMAIARLTDKAICLPSTDTVHEIVERYQGNLAAAARALGMPRSTLRDRIGRGPKSEKGVDSSAC